MQQRVGDEPRAQCRMGRTPSLCRACEQVDSGAMKKGAVERVNVVASDGVAAREKERGAARSVLGFVICGQQASRARTAKQSKSKHS